MPKKLQNLEQLLDHMVQLAEGEAEVSLGMVVESIGNRAFGPLLMLIGLILVSPFSGVPGMAVTMAIFVALMASQLLMGRRRFWLPGWLLNRSVKRDRLLGAVRRLRPLARRVDRLLRPRLTTLVDNDATYVIAALCLLIALGMPMMEMVPFSASAAGVALGAFGLSLVVQDGLLVLLAGGWIVATFVLIVVNIV